MNIVTPWDAAKAGDVIARQSPTLCRLVQKGIPRRTDAKRMAGIIGPAAHVWLDGPRKFAVVQFEIEAKP